VGSVKVSVIMPTYNRLQFLQDAVSSYLEQDYPDRELCVYDDGSTDGTAEFFADAKNKSGIRYLRSEENRGQAHALNAALGMAQGDLICQLHSDDMFRGVDSITSRVAVFKDLQAQGITLDVLFTDAECVDGCGQYIKDWVGAPSNAARAWGEDFVHFVTMMWRREVNERIGGFPEYVRWWMDADFTIRCMMECQCLHMARQTIIYRRHRGQEGMSPERRLAETKEAESRIVRERLSARYLEKYGLVIR